MIFQFTIVVSSEFKFPRGKSLGINPTLMCDFSSVKQDLEYDQLIIDPRSEWSNITDRLSGTVSKPVNLRRTSSANNTNPWGSTVSLCV